MDHIDRNGLNNCRNNLRVCDYAQNRINSKVSENNVSGYKGVIFKKSKWVAQLHIANKLIYLGSFKSPLDASKAYNSTVLKYFGTFKRDL